MRKGKLLIVNTAVLTAGSIIMRSISVSFNVYLSNKIGSVGIGLFELISTVYGLVITFACGGVKLGSTRLVSDAEIKNKDKTYSVMKTCIKYSLATGFTAAATLFIFSSVISRKWIADDRAEIPLKILAFSLPATAVSSALNGYFTAKKSMTGYALVQLTEQIIKIIITVIFLNFFGNSGTEYACCAVSLGITCSEIFSAVGSYLMYRNERINLSSKYAGILHELLHISLPEVAGGGCRSILLTVEHILIPEGFRKSGHSPDKAMGIYGIIHGMALPVVLYPSAFLSSLSSMLIPELSQLKSTENKIGISCAATISIRYSLLLSIGTGIFFFVFSDTVSLGIYSGTESSFYIRLLGVLVPIMYTDMITDGLLKGLDEQAASMRYNIFDSLICVILVSILVPVYSIGGYVFILFLSEIINFCLSINRLIKKAQLIINPINDIIKPLISGLVCCYSVRILITLQLSKIFAPTLILAIGLIICISAYLILLYLLGSITKKDIALFKSLLKK